MSEQAIEHGALPDQGHLPRRLFRDPNEVAAREVGIKLLREILDYQQRLNQMPESTLPEQLGLVNAYRRAIRVRREMLRDLPGTPDHAAP
ncbi:MAG TPA: hypothetical protein VLA56_22045 [Pseudomonadales bacterium]|nr:hypothetical protein [Pseudomonadales bacterium]